MSDGKNQLAAIWSLVDEKARLMEAAGLLLLSPEAECRRYVRPIIALACTLAICLIPLVSAGEEAYAVMGRLVR